MKSQNSRIRSAKGRSVSSTKWLKRQLNDPFVQQAKKENYRARSVYKLLELDEKYQLLKKGAGRPVRVADLGSAPGSWSQYARRKGAFVVAIDLLSMEPIDGVHFIQGDFLQLEAIHEMDKISKEPFDLVMSDIAPNATGNRAVDRLRAQAVGDAVLDFADQRLAAGGHMLVKMIKGAEAELTKEVQKKFRSHKILRPKATRSDSSETFVLALAKRTDSVS